MIRRYLTCAAVLFLARLWPAAAVTTSAYRSVIIYYETNSSRYVSYVNQLRNLLGHFKTAVVYKDIALYTSAEKDAYEAAFFIGGSFSASVPPAFLTDVTNRSQPLVWINYKIDGLLTNVATATQLGLTYIGNSNGYDRVTYAGEELIKPTNYTALVTLAVTSPAVTLATAYAATNAVISPVPYAVRSSNFWYFADNPFHANTLIGRDLVLHDQLHDILHTSAATNRRALVRLEDLSPFSSADRRARLLAEVADLQGRGIRATLGIIPWYRDPTNVYNGPTSLHMSEDRDFQNTIRQCVRMGMNYMAHGYTHQRENGVSGEAYEFWNDTLQQPMDEDSWDWAAGRVDASRDEFLKCGFPVRIWEAPHYTCSLLDHFVFTSRYSARYERIGVFNTFTDGLTIDQIAGVSSNQTTMDFQYVPYTIHRSIYGATFLPENVGYYSPTRADLNGLYRNTTNMVAYARSLRVVRDAVASFYFHDFTNGPAILTNLIAQIQDLGYTFTDIHTLIREDPVE